MKKAIVYEENPCEECDFCRAFCDGDFEYCQIHGAPIAKRWPDILDESDDGFVKYELRDLFAL